MKEQVEVALNKVDSPYRAVLIAARRAKQIQRGSAPVVEPELPKSVAIAVKELALGKLEYEIPEEEEEDLFGDLSLMEGEL